MARLSEEKINEIRQSVDIVDVIGNYLSLERKGRNYVALCPFHNDSRPSLSISQEKQIYRCFVCNNGGNVFTFLQNYLKISYIEAVKMVAKMSNIDLGEYTFKEYKPVINEELEPLYKMHEEAHKIYNYYLQTKDALAAKEYLNKRNLTQDIIDQFGIGYAPNQNILMKAFQNKGYSPFEIYNSGLVIESKVNYDRYKDRIMFPLHNPQGRIIGFSGRIYRQGSTDSKYMNSPESKIFNKSETLYNYHRVKDEVRLAKSLIVLEGFMDVIALYKAGIKNCVAIMGTAFTQGHISLIKRLTKNIILCLDGDNAGISAMNKIIDSLKGTGLNVSVVLIPDGNDPDEFLEKHGKDALINLFKNPISEVEFKMEYNYKHVNVDNYEDKKKYLESMIPLISSLTDEIDREHYIDILCKKTGFTQALVQRLVSSNTKNVQVQPIPQERVRYRKSVQIIDKYEKAERDLLYYMMKDRKYCDIYEAKAGYMYDNINRLIASYIVDYYRKHTSLDIANLISTIQNNAIIQKILEIASMQLPELANNQAIDDYISTIQEKLRLVEIEGLDMQLKSTYDPKEQAKILKQIIQLKKE